MAQPRHPRRPDLPPIDELIAGRVYVLGCNNLTLGVWDSERKRFIGIRDKGFRRYLDCEAHFDHGPPWSAGTVWSAISTEIDLPKGLIYPSQAMFDFLLKIEADRGETPPPYDPFDDET